MIKRILTSLFVFFIMLGAALAGVSEAAPRVTVLYTNNAQTTYDKAVDKKLMENIKKTLAGGFEYVDGAKYMKALDSAGMNDVSMAERQDILDVLSGEGLDYIICMAVEPPARKETVTVFSSGIKMAASVPFKIIDARTNKYLYNGKFVEKGSGKNSLIGRVGNKSVMMEALGKINKKINAVIDEKMARAKAKGESRVL